MTLVLVVEDRKEKLADRVSLFEELGCKVVPADNTDEALRQMRYCPNFDLVVTDINFAEQDNRTSDPSADASGLALGKWIKKEGYPTLTAGYSAHFEDNSPTSVEAEKIFTRYARKGEVTGRALPKVFAEWIKEASEKKEARLQKAMVRVRKIAEVDSAKAMSPDLERVRTLLISSESDPLRESCKALRDSGFQLEILEPIAHNGSKVGNAFLAWLRTTKDSTDIEIFQHPHLYASAESSEECLVHVADLMVGYFIDLKEEQNTFEHLERTKKFLMEVFEDIA